MTKFILFFLLILFAGGPAFGDDLVLVDATKKVSIIYDAHGPALDSIAAHLLQKDIQRVTGYLPFTSPDRSKARGTVIFIGNVNSALIQAVAAGRPQFLSRLRGKWECYGLAVAMRPLKKVDRALIIAGSDARGTAYGVFSISEKIGVSPWYWWADVPVIKKQVLRIAVRDFISSTPDVKYRGIFLNDEDWGLQPWAAKTFEPETSDIGPKTYAKIFELLLRLKANLIWPAMHPSTKAFYSYPGNKKVAADYHIVVGSSHAEPMLRNNVGEWNESAMGDFNYLTNKDKVYDYWEQRVKESSTNDAIYTMGMRGVHDSGIEGVSTVQETVPLLERIISDQRSLLKKYINPDVTKIPQVFTAYKEVLEIYDHHLEVPGDITLVWPDDNYGYIQRLTNEQEKKRAGGSGIYYHASYWGRPHDYLWISSTNPALIREEMMKAYDNGTKQLWVLNVGDLKPIEYNTQFFLDMAYHAEPFKNSSYVDTHAEGFARRIFGTRGTAIAGIWRSYNRLAFERRPEFMGWSQTEPTTPTTYTAYNHFYYGDEGQRRIDAYSALEKQVKALRKSLPAAQQDAFYELVYYPVMGASLMNKKFLYRDKSYWYALQNRASAEDYAKESKLAYDSIVAETNYYNNRLAGGKWKYMMSMQPRDLPVYLPPVIAQAAINRSPAWGIAPEGWINTLSSGAPTALPVFNRRGPGRYFVDIFLSDDQTLRWTTSSEKWITLSRESGTLSAAPGKKEVRIWVTINWAMAPASERSTGTLAISAGGLTKVLAVTIARNAGRQLVNFKGTVENNGYLAIPATRYNRVMTEKAAWKIVENLGTAGDALQASWSDNEKKPARVEYDFYTFTEGTPVINIYTLPSLPLTNERDMRYAVAIDDGPKKVISFKTTGRTEEWKLNVLRNSAIKQYTGQPLSKGRHTLKIDPLDPGIVFQRFTVDLGGLKNAYGTIPAN